MSANGRRGKLTVKVLTFGQMGTNTKVIGSTF